MTLKNQFDKLKENWLIAILILILLVMPYFSGQVGNTLGVRDSFAEMAYGNSMQKASYYYDEGFAPEVEERKITKNTYLDLEIEKNNFDQKVSELKSLIKNNNAILTNENVQVNEYGNTEYQYGDFTIKVPVDNYDNLISGVTNLGEKKSLTESATDITASYENLEIELEAEQEKLRRYEELYDSSINVEEKISLTDRIFQQERTIKYLQERINNMDLKVEYSTVYLSMIEEKSAYALINFVDFSEVVKTGVNSFNGMILLIIKILPYAIVLLIIYLIFKKKR